MYEIEQDDLPEEFLRAWVTAGKHIEYLGQKSVKWIRANLNKPFVEHMSFSLGNQLFFVFVEIDTVPFAPHKELFLEVCNEAGAIACVFRMRRTLSSFEPAFSGWGLLNATTNQIINPLEMLTDEMVPMTSWEIHDFGIQIVRSHIEEEGHEVTSSQSSLHIDPSIWFIDKTTNEMCWVVVRSVTYPRTIAERPNNIEAIAKHCEKMGDTGYFASVSIASSLEAFDPILDKNIDQHPVYRGLPAKIKFLGLEQI